MTDQLIKYGVRQVLGPTIQQQQQPSVPPPQPKKKGRWFWSRKQEDDRFALLTDHERRILKKVKSRAHTLDKGFTCCGFSVGLDPIIGLIPVIGDFLGLLLALRLVQTASKVDLPQAILSQMMVNIVIDFLIGLVPIVGDLMDFMYKCNTRNAALLESHLYKRNQKRAARNPLIPSDSAPAFLPHSSSSHPSSPSTSQYQGNKNNTKNSTKAPAKK
ncbi:hypothetical protein BCR43DRAFT_497945 [Syncephalastrum racemosum]|uniref:PH domain-containing protein n=1 Tax=Syncephalastrum racemosum TaxID=13706 RepID=A0A1X2H328_SYNRA|nr:hypothetical protein BCR43DRAFT_497945 [Syncephalastrum racemosum]